MRRIRLALFGALLALACVAAAPMPADALTVSPPLYDYDLDPGDTVKDYIKVFNELTESITLYPSVANFTAGTAENGAPQFYDATNDPYGTALAQWIKMDSDEPITLAPGQRANVGFSIAVPADAAPGGHYGALLLGSSPSGVIDSTLQVGVGSQTGVLALVNVTGEVRENGDVVEYGFTGQKSTFNSLPVDLFFRMENSGTTHLRPAGTIEITDMFGRKVATLDVNTDLRSVLPNSVRRFSFDWKKTDMAADASELSKEWNNFAFGPHKATLMLSYGMNNQTLVKTVGFSVWPIRVMGIVLLIVLVIVLLLVMMIRSYNKMIIAKFKEQMAKQQQGGSGMPK